MHSCPSQRALTGTPEVAIRCAAAASPGTTRQVSCRAAAHAAGQLPGCGPGSGHVGAALLGDTGAESQQRGLRRDLSGDQGLSLAEDDGALDQARWDEENTAWVKAASASELSRISTRLSACESTFSGIFCGRWVDTSR